MRNGILVASTVYGIGGNFDRAAACTLAPFNLLVAAEQADVIALGRVVDGASLETRFEVERSFGSSPIDLELRIDNREITPAADCSRVFTDERAHPSGRYLALLEEGDDGAFVPAWFGAGMLRVEEGELTGPDFASDFQETVDWLAEEHGSHELEPTPDGGNAISWLTAAFALGIIGAGGAAYLWLRRSRSGAP